MAYDHYLILYILHKFRGERSIQAVYHLFRGKKSSQTIQDSLLYQLSEFFESAPSIQLKMLHRITQELLKENAIEVHKEDHFVLTTTGKRLLSQMETTYSIPTNLNGYRYGKAAHHLWPRLSLIVQTLSFLMEGNHSFIPMTNNQHILLSVKEFLKGRNADSLASTLYRELYELLSTMPRQERDMFVLRLSGSHRVGLTIEQLGNRQNMSQIQCHIVFESILHSMINKLIETPHSYSLLYSLIDYKVNKHLTESTTQTFSLLQKGMTIEKIAQVRGLKLSTIEDHLVEIALLVDGFDIAPYVSEEVAEQIRHIIHQENTHRLRIIKAQLGHSVSYLQIRLVLAKERLRGHANA